LGGSVPGSEVSGAGRDDSLSSANETSHMGGLHRHGRRTVLSLRVRAGVR
jgi:hypothetical protein